MSNREAVRDDLFKLLRDAGSVGSPSDPSQIAAATSVQDGGAPGATLLAAMRRSTACSCHCQRTPVIGGAHSQPVCLSDSLWTRHPAAFAGVSEMAALMRARAGALIGQLLPANFEEFAQIFTSAVLQVGLLQLLGGRLLNGLTTTHAAPDRRSCCARSCCA